MNHDVYGKSLPLDLGAKYGDYLRPGATAIVSIDMHEGHLSEDAGCPCPAPRGREIVHAIDDFHAQARRSGVPVIHVRSELRSSGVDDVRGASSSAWRRTFPEYVGEIAGADEHALSGSHWLNFVTHVDPHDEVISGKKRLSAFYPTDLDFLLRQMGITSVIFDGIMADCCILNSAFEASNLGYRVVVPSDLVRGTDEQLEASALAIISLHVGLVMTSADIESVWAEARLASSPA